MWSGGSAARSRARSLASSSRRTAAPSTRAATSTWRRCRGPPRGARRRRRARSARCRSSRPSELDGRPAARRDDARCGAPLRRRGRVRAGARAAVRRACAGRGRGRGSPARLPAARRRALRRGSIARPRQHRADARGTARPGAPRGRGGVDRAVGVGARRLVRARARRRQTLPLHDRTGLRRPAVFRLAPHAPPAGGRHDGRRGRTARRPPLASRRRRAQALGRRREGRGKSDAAAQRVGAAHSPLLRSMTLLSEAAVAAELAETPGWKRVGKTIDRTYRFQNFKDAMFFVNGVAARPAPSRPPPPAAGPAPRPPPPPAPPPRRSTDGRALGDVLGRRALYVIAGELAALRDIAVGLLAADLLQLRVRVEHGRLARGTPAERQETGEDERQGPRPLSRLTALRHQTRVRSARAGTRFGAGWKRHRSSVRSRTSTYAPITIR